MIMRPDFEYRTRNIRVTIGDREPKPGDDENVITGNAFCGEFVGPGQVGGESIVTCGGISSQKHLVFTKNLKSFSEPLRGKFMVLQRTVEFNNESLNWMEVIVNFEPMSLNPEEKVMAAVNNDVIF